MQPNRKLLGEASRKRLRVRPFRAQREKRSSLVSHLEGLCCTRKISDLGAFLSTSVSGDAKERPS